MAALAFKAVCLLEDVAGDSFLDPTLFASDCFFAAVDFVADLAGDASFVAVFLEAFFDPVCLEVVLDLAFALAELGFLAAAFDNVPVFFVAALAFDDMVFFASDLLAAVFAGVFVAFLDVDLALLEAAFFPADLLVFIDVPFLLAVLTLDVALVFVAFLPVVSALPSASFLPAVDFVLEAAALFVADLALDLASFLPALPVDAVAFLPADLAVVGVERRFVDLDFARAAWPAALAFEDLELFRLFLEDFCAVDFVPSALLPDGNA